MSNNALIPTKMNYDINMHSDKFETAKQKIETFSKQLPEKYSLSSVETDKGFGEFLSDIIFGRGLGLDHKVTGEELNKIISKIGNILCDINDIEIKLVKEFGTLYTALDALDKDYLTGIVAALEENKTVSNALAVTQDDLEKTVSQQEETLRKIVLFKSDIEQFKEDLEKFRDKAKERIGLLKKEHDKQSTEITQLMSNFQNVDVSLQGLNSQVADLEILAKHSEVSIQSIHDNISNCCADISDIKNDIVDIGSTIDAKEQSIESIKRLVTNIQDKIDKDTKDFLGVQDKVDTFSDSIQAFSKEIDGTHTQINDLNTQLNDISITIDAVKSTNSEQDGLLENLTQKHDEQIAKIHDQELKVDAIQSATVSADNRINLLESEIKEYQAKFTKLSYILYATMGISVISIILALTW